MRPKGFRLREDDRVSISSAQGGNEGNGLFSNPAMQPIDRGRYDGDLLLGDQKSAQCER